MASDKIKIRIPTFHKKMEDFFEKQKKEATFPKAIGLFLLAVLLMAVLVSLDDYISLGILNIRLGSEDTLVVFNSLSNLILFALVFGILIAFLSFLGRSFFKSKGTLIQNFYLLSFPMLFFALNSYIFHFLPDSVLWLSWISTLIGMYLMAVAIKVINNINYGGIILMLIIGFILFVVLINIVMIYIYLPIHIAILRANSEDTVSDFVITNHSDGSFTASYIWSFNSTGMVRRICNITFPVGWEYGNQEVVQDIIMKEIGRNASATRYRTVFYKNYSFDDNAINEYFLFTNGPPQIIPTELLSSIIRGHERKNDQSIESMDILDRGSVEYLDVILQKSQKTIVKHEIALRAKNNMGYEAVYVAPYSKDDDLDYIIGNTICYGN